MKPERTNYHIWILDYLDGRLDEEKTGLLIKFLDENPDVREEFDLLAGYETIKEKVIYPGKHILKRNLSDLPGDQFELLCVGALENDLSAEQNQELRQYLEEYPERKKIFLQIQKIKLSPPSVEFRYKHKIRKHGLAERRIRFLIPVISAAACLLTLIWISTPEKDKTEDNNILISLDDKTVTDAETNSSDSTSSFRTKDITATLNQELNEGDIITTVLVPHVSEFNENAARENINLSPLSFKDNMNLYLIPVENLQIIKLQNMTNSVNITEETNHGIKYYLARFVREKIIKTDSGNDGAIKPYEIAEAGIVGLNKLLGWQMSFNEYTDEKGELLAINFNSKLLKLNLPVKRNESDE